MRIADLADSSLIARRLCPIRRWVVGAPAISLDTARRFGRATCASTPAWATPGLRPGRPGSSPMPAERSESVSVKGPLSATNGEALTAALVAGLGIALQPDFLAWDMVRTGTLVTVLDDWAAPPLALHLVTPAGPPRPLRVAVLLEFLTARFKSGVPPWTANLASDGGG